MTYLDEFWRILAGAAALACLAGAARLLLRRWTAPAAAARAREEAELAAREREFLQSLDQLAELRFQRSELPDQRNRRRAIHGPPPVTVPDI